MWLRTAPHRLLGRSVATLLAMFVLGGALNWGHVGGDDRDCDVVVTHHDHTAHRFSAAIETPSSSDHCYICHSLRLLHQAVTSRCERLAITLRVLRRPDGDVLAVRRDLQVGLASRAPPSVRL